MNPENPILHLSGLQFAWHPGEQLTLDIEQLDLNQGERLFVAGNSGSGKSTLLSLLAGVLLPQQGRLNLLGKELTQMSGSRRDHFRADHIGFIFQQFNLIPYLSMVENVTLPCQFSRLRRQRAMDDAGDVNEEAIRLLSHLDLKGDMLSRPVTKLSVGQQQRVAAARALMGAPEVVIADEPTSALDADRRIAFVELLFRECELQGSSLIFVSHDSSLMDEFDRHVFMHDINRATLGGGCIMPILRLAIKSLINRRMTALLTLMSIAFSMIMLLGVERMRVEARAGFTSTISGTDLIVGARSGSIQLLLYSVFRIGNPTNNIDWESYQEIAANKRIAWTVPISLGDSHRGYRVMGTTQDFFRHYKYARKRSLEFMTGQPFNDLYDAVVGAEVAEKLGYQLGQKITLAHGASDVEFARHENKPFTITGILERTGTPTDRTVMVSLQAIEAIHVDWQAGAPVPGLNLTAEQARHRDLEPKVITAFMVGLKSKISTFRIQRMINEYRKEPLLAILPGVALQELWDLMAIAENALLIIAGFVVIVGLIGMLTALLTSLNERRREMAILRSLGARPAHVFGLLVGEAFFVIVTGVVLGILGLYALFFLAQPWLESAYGLYLMLGPPSQSELLITLSVVVTGTVVGCIPAWRAYRYSLADGMSIRI